MLRGPKLVFLPDLVARLRRLGFEGKTPEAVVRSAVRFVRDVGKADRAGGIHKPAQQALRKLNEARPIIDELAMSQPLSGFFGGWLVNLKVIPSGPDMTHREASNKLGSAFGEVQMMLIQKGLTTGESKEDGFSPVFDEKRLRQLKRQATPEALKDLALVARARELAQAMRHGFRESRIRVGLMERKRQGNPHSRRLARRGMR